MKIFDNYYKTFAIIIFSIFFTFIIYRTSFGRYISNSFNNYILESQNFYFNSTILATSDPTYSITNWDGTNEYSVTIDVNSKKNEFISTNYDIAYNVSVECPDTVICSVSKQSGVINKLDKTDSYVVTMNPIGSFSEGESVVFYTSATSVAPYTKKIGAYYSVGVEDYGFSYGIIDSAGSKVLTLELTNSKPYYEVKTAFGEYNVGDQISLEDYQNLTDLEKTNCVSIRVRVSFNPEEILLDLNGKAYAKRISMQTTTLNNYTYVEQIDFYMDANSNEIITFYKVNPSLDYTNSTLINVEQIVEN